MVGQGESKDLEVPCEAHPKEEADKDHHLVHSPRPNASPQRCAARTRKGFLYFKKYLLVHVLVQVVRDGTEHDTVGDEQKENREVEEGKLGDSTMEMAAPVLVRGLSESRPIPTNLMPNLGLADAHLGAASSTIRVIKVTRAGMA